MVFRRTATSAAELAGQPVAAGDKVVVSFASANRDEAVFDDPDHFDVERDASAHLAFGHGPHFCLGAHLARAQMRALFGELLAPHGVDRAGGRAGAACGRTSSAASSDSRSAGPSDGAGARVGCLERGSERGEGRHDVDALTEHVHEALLRIVDARSGDTVDSQRDDLGCVGRTQRG